MSSIWLTTPVEWHSSREASYNLTEFTEAEQALLFNKWWFWYEADHTYGHTVVSGFCAAIAFGLVLHLVSTLRTRKSTSPAATARAAPSVLDRITAFFRYTTARQYRPGVLGYYSPPLSALIVVGALFIFCFGLMLGPHPYYWPSMKFGHSQPVATRSGWIAIAIMPFMIASASKVNFIATLCGTSHEKVQVFHRWSAVVMYVAALVHTFPFIVKQIEAGTMRETWFTDGYYVTGVAALVPQTYLIAFSWSIFRNRYYEWFKKLHFIAAAFFLVVLFLHCGYTLTSWDYFWATLALFSVSWLLRTGRTLYNSSLLALPASLSLLSSPSSDSDKVYNGDTDGDKAYIQLSIPVSPRVKWAPGQHVFVRFMDLGLGWAHWCSSHPFTVVSAPKDGQVTLVIKQHAGITAALGRRLRSRGSSESEGGKVSVQTRVYVDGPYGGIPVNLKGYERVMLLAGGSGSTTILPILNDLMQSENEAKRKVDFLVAVREQSAYTWMEDALLAAVSSSSSCPSSESTELALRFHITGASSQLASKQSLDSADDAFPSDSLKQPTTASLSSHEERGRPNLRAIIHKACRETDGGRLAIVACGPEGFLYDVRNTVAGCQLDILDGYGCREVFLHTENYSW